MAGLVMEVGSEEWESSSGGDAHGDGRVDRESAGAMHVVRERMEVRPGRNDWSGLPTSSSRPLATGHQTQPWNPTQPKRTYLISNLAQYQ